MRNHAGEVCSRAHALACVADGLALAVVRSPDCAGSERQVRAERGVEYLDFFEAILTAGGKACAILCACVHGLVAAVSARRNAGAFWTCVVEA